MSVYLITDQSWEATSTFLSFYPDWLKYLAISFVGASWTVGEDVGRSACLWWSVDSFVSLLY